MKRTAFVFTLTLFIFVHDNATSQELSEEHWNFICRISRQVLEEIVNCYLPQEMTAIVEAYERLKNCTGMNLTDIIEAHCPDKEFPEAKRNLIHACIIIEGFVPPPRNEPNPIIGCVESRPEF